VNPLTRTFKLTYPLDEISRAHVLSAFLEKNLDDQARVIDRLKLSEIK
jgi:hypothetical protein